MAATSWSDHSDTHILREIGLSHLNRRIGKTFNEWKKNVRDDFGKASERRLYRALQWLIDHGLVSRSDTKVEDPNDELDGLYYLYFRVRDWREVPRNPPCVRCGICGMEGVTRKTHVGYRDHQPSSGRLLSGVVTRAA
jgi:hypothetical protein